MGASLFGPGTGALRAACAREKEACAEASGVVGDSSDSSVQVNGAPEGASVGASEGACVVTFGPLEELAGLAADGHRDTFLFAQVEAGMEGGRSQDPVEGSLRQGTDLVVQWGVLGRIGAHHWRVKAEEGPWHLGGWRGELRE